jgi:hypothetical protein
MFQPNRQPQNKVLPVHFGQMIETLPKISKEKHGVRQRIGGLIVEGPARAICEAKYRGNKNRLSRETQFQGDEEFAQLEAIPSLEIPMTMLREFEDRHGLPAPVVRSSFRFAEMEDT